MHQADHIRTDDRSNDVSMKIPITDMSNNCSPTVTVRNKQLPRALRTALISSIQGHRTSWSCPAARMCHGLPRRRAARAEAATDPRARCEASALLSNQPPKFSSHQPSSPPPSAMEFDVEGCGIGEVGPAEFAVAGRDTEARRSSVHTHHSHREHTSSITASTADFNQKIYIRYTTADGTGWRPKVQPWRCHAPSAPTNSGERSSPAASLAASSRARD